jgi:N-acetylglucosaminyl-diphospho-decaprenol L-rhamnosyltransferase
MRMTPMAVAIVNYNTRENLRSCLHSIEPQAPGEVIVVDNASADGSTHMIRTEYPHVIVRTNHHNLGYGAAANQAIAACETPYVLLLNADTVLQPGAVHALSTYLDAHPRAAVVGPRLVDVNGTLQASTYAFPSPFHTLLENSMCAIRVGRWIRRSVPGLRRLYLRTWPHDAARVVPWLKGAALAIRCDAFRAVGGFDESFFMYFEDADLCYRLTRAGWEIHFAPVATVVHAGAASTSQYPTEMAVRLFDSTVQFYRRHYSAFRLAQMLVLMRGLMFARWIAGHVRLRLTTDPRQRTHIIADIASIRRILFG